MLTDLAIKKLKPGPKRYEKRDGRGLRVVVQPSGVRSFAFRYKFGGRANKITFGPTEIGVAAARKLAADCLLDLAQGRDPGAARRAAKKVEADAAADTLQAICQNWLKREGSKQRSGARKGKDLERLVYPAMGGRPIAEIKRSEIVKLLDKIEDANGATMSDATLLLLGRIFNWHASRSDDFRSPIIRGMRRTKPSERVRERVLSDDELRAVWNAASASDDPFFGGMVKLLLLTGARRNEINFMRRSEIDGEGNWLLPAARNKTKVDLKRPLSKAARGVLARLPEIDGGDFVFSMGNGAAIGHLSRRKQRLDAAAGVTNWTIHDLRRTARSLMSRAGVPREHAERCLGHVIGGVEGVYNKHQYRDEMALALERLAALIARVVDPQPNVIALEAKG
jgi:integrase